MVHAKSDEYDTFNNELFLKGFELVNIRDIDHLTLTVTDIARSLRFYHEVFDLPIVTFDGDRQAVLVGKQKINFQTTDQPHQPIAAKPTPGSADLCLIAKDNIDDIQHHLKSYFVDVIAGPVERTGAHGKLTSLYVRDPDNNLIEISNYH
ncbi:MULTISPECIES: VOC family protein [Lactiplantibacillus]|uniref:VOC family protein n=1 Tax=Lactiplantibacillus TaxID=2767842 RepID=UPI00034E1C9F|nr:MULTISPECIES: VOC family protein [Lactiplantibacillus]AGL64828.2 Ring-cleaving dioxygenase (Putative) [Lactiplantibacillus plantarum subsp. plantarum P-8]AGO08683.1 lactoylglutathione lyase family protein [Lactiplantibacillus plantarum 16]AQY72205.1 VOC family virulence protein [Lactiplantibacillus plantarum]ASD31904.1 VOC family virulence protein [Lactiplantibacillus plantarum]AUH38629.1 VOC family virulence protein [Lactiplantibacillus plantarum]